ncbi:MAG: hypothetical protein NVS2B12_26890 [Ktedonobacteraceae bacterium]
MLQTTRAGIFGVLLGIFILLSVAASASASAYHPVADHDASVRSFTLASPDFKDGKPLPATSEFGGGFGCSGKNIAPSLYWKNVPTGSKSFALVMNDLDAAIAGGFHHWIVYNIPAKAHVLKGNAPYTEGTNSLSTHAYFGPCPPATSQIHHYVFTLYALDVDNIATAGLTYDNLIQAISGHVVGAVTIVGTFHRDPSEASS